jgi:hypothetical protein
MSLEEIKKLATLIGLCLDNVTTLERARSVLIRAAKEIVNY